MSIDLSQFYQVFFDETEEHLAAMEALLLRLDVAQPDLEDLNAIFRAAHSIKGGAGTFGFDDLAQVTHELESLLDKLRKQEFAITVDMVDAFLAAGDVLKDQLHAHREGQLAEPFAAEKVCENLRLLAFSQASSSSAAATSAPASPPQTYCLQFEAKRPFASDALLSALAELGQVEVLQQPVEGPVGLWLLRVITTEPETTLLENLAFVIDPSAIHLSVESSLSAASATTAATDYVDDPDGQYGFFELLDDAAAPAILAEEECDGYGFFVPLDQPLPAPMEEEGFGFFIDPATLPAQSGAQPEVVEEHARVEADLAKISTASKEPERSTAAATSAAVESTIRVNVEKVDLLLNLVGELVITQSMLAQNVLSLDPVLYQGLLDGVVQLERNTRELQESVMSIRMMPISSVFNRFPRVVRDLAARLKKQVELRMVGEKTELDKGFIEKLTDPLTHLVRNSLDHGIESTEERQKKGKNPVGTLTLRAFHQGGNIVIEIADDGAGLSRDRILAKAKERGLNLGDNMSDAEVWQLIFEPGFSTAAAVTDVSGRGVGMDVVRRNIHAMGGRIDISTMLDVGTTMTIRLPLTLAILDGMSIAVGEQKYIIPLTFIVESLQPKPNEVKTLSGKGRVINVRGEYLPLIALHELFNLTPKHHDPEKGLAIILESEGSKIALFVDDLLGQHQVVIKNLETNYRKVPGLSGATIMGDGRVALILDVASLVRMAQKD